MDLKNIFKIKQSFKKKRIEPKPDFYWRILVTVVFILIGLSFAFSFYLFLKVKAEPIPQDINSKKSIEKERLEEALQIFSNREEKSKQIINSPAGVSDPSI